MPESDSSYDVIIVGTGHAGYTLAKLLAKRSPELSLLLVTADDGANYSKPMLSNGLAKNKSVADLASQSAEQMAQTLGASVLTHTTVLAVDAEQRSINVSSFAGSDKSQAATSFSYRSLVLACGAQQIKLPIEGDGANDVLTVNDLADYGRFTEKLSGIERVAVMGPGLIGCEFANDLAAVGKTAVIIGPDTRALERLVPEVASTALMAAMEAFNTEWHLQTVVIRIDKATSGYELTLASGAVVTAGLVLSAAGLKPDLSLAQSAGLKTSLGIVVDRFMRSSNADIYAIGDCAEVEGMVLPYIMPIMHAARALSSTLSGEPAQVSYPAMPVLIKTPVHPVVVATPPPGVSGEWKTESVDDGARALYFDDSDSLRGFVLTGSHVSAKGKLERELPKLIP